MVMMDIPDAVERVQQEDLIDNVALCYAAGCTQVRSILAMLKKMEVEATDEQVRALVAWPTKSELGKEFWRRVDEAKDEVTALRALGKRAIKDAHKAYLGQRVLMSEANEDKRTRSSAQQYHLGAVGHSPSQKHELTGSEDLLRLAKEIFEPKANAE